MSDAAFYVFAVAQGSGGAETGTNAILDHLPLARGNQFVALFWETRGVTLTPAQSTRTLIL